MHDETKKMNDVLRISLFGELEIRTGDRLITDFASRKAMALIAYLARNPGMHSRERMATMLWDDRAQDRALGNLRVVLTSIRRQLDPYVTITRTTVGLKHRAADPTAAPNGDAHQASIWIDVNEFEEDLARILGSLTAPRALDRQGALRLEEALDLVQGEFLHAFNIRKAREFEAWVTYERERIQHQVVQALEQLIDHYLAEQQFARGIPWAQRLTQAEPLHERGHQQMMLLLHGNNQRNAALSHYATLVDLLHEEMGIAPSAETNAIQQQILDNELDQGTPRAIEPVIQPLVASVARTAPSTLPLPLTPLIGRDHERQHVVNRLLEPQCRLLTLVGPGGIGKTRLSLAVAADLQEAAPDLFPDGRYFVALDGVESADHIATAIAESLGVSLTETAAANLQLINYLRHRQLLLVADNFEHLLDGADLILSILQAAPGVKVLVTSREQLNFHGEWLIELEGLAYPEAVEPDNALGTEIVDLYPAIELFARNAVAVRTSFSLDDELGAVIHICRWLEGIPLGIQLAAASVRAFSCQEILESIRRSLDFLRTDMRNLPDRHRSLRAVFEHSWSLLTAEEQRALRQLAVFAGRFSMDAADHVAGVSSATLRALVNRSLVQPISLDEEEEAQYKIHAILRQYAVEKLEENGQEEQATRERHAGYFTELLVDLQTRLEDRDSAVALARIGADLENFRAAWNRSVQYLNLDRLGRALPGLSRYYQLRGPFQEGSAALEDAETQLRTYLQRTTAPAEKAQSVLSRILAAQAGFFNLRACYDDALSTARETVSQAHLIRDAVAEAEGHLQASIALRFLGDFSAAVTAAEQALLLAQTHKFPVVEGEALVHIGVIHIFHDSRYDQAQRHLEQALELYRTEGNRRREGTALNGLGILHLYQGRYGEARGHYEQGLNAFREVGDRKGEALELNNLGVVSHHLGNFEQAHAYYQDALTIREQLGEFQGIGLTSGNLGLLAHHQGDQQVSFTYSVVAQRIAHERGDRDSEAFALFTLANAQLELGDLRDAAQSFQQALELRLALGQVNQSFEAQAGLIRAELALGNAEQHVATVDAILASMENNNLIGIVDPFAIYWTCYLVLRRVDDERANAVLEHAYSLLRERADRIRSTALRQTFLTSWPARRQVTEEYLRVDV